MEFCDKPQFKKGRIGEKIIDDYLKEKGYVIYNPQEEDKAHAFDRLAIKNKKKIIIAEAKSKARRKYYPDTGIDIKHFDEYSYIQKKYKIPVFIFFVDEENAEIYGNFMSKLVKGCLVKHKNKSLVYPILNGGIIYFPMKKMIIIKKLTQGEVVDLKNMTTKKDEYKPD
jgi:hypothetical protein